ncbi:MAG: pilin [Patescibacteria group bacterium]
MRIIFTKNSIAALGILFFLGAPVFAVHAAYSDTFLGGGQNCTPIPGTPIRYKCPSGLICNTGVTPPKCVSSSTDFFGALGVTSGGAGSGALNYSPLRFWANAINWLLGILGIFAVGAIVYGGIKFMTAGGEQDKAKAASKTVFFAVLGLVTIALAWVIGSVILKSIAGIIK